MRYYLASYTGTGAELDPFRPAIADLVPPGTSWLSCDGRADATLVAGWALVAANVSTAVHALLAADPRVTVVPIVDAGGAPLGLTDTIAQIPAATRTTLRAALEARHIPANDLQLTDTIRQALTRIIGRCLIRQVLKAVDLTEGLDTTVGAMTPARRNQIIPVLAAAGFDTSGVVLTDTIRQAIAKILANRGTIGVGDAVP
jgi:hypothetical protein